MPLAKFEFLGGGCVDCTDGECDCRHYEIELEDWSSDVIILTTSDGKEHYFVHSFDEALGVDWIEATPPVRISVDITNLPYVRIAD